MSARAWLGDARGVAAIEFAFVAPFLLVLLIAVSELGLPIRTELLAQEAVAAGAQYAIQGFNSAVITSARLDGTA